MANILIMGKYWQLNTDEHCTVIF